PLLDELERDLDQRLASKRIADLNRRPLLVGAFEILRGKDGGSADSVSARQCAVEDDRVPDALRARGEHALPGEESDAHGVDERVRGVRLVEGGLAADGRHADTVAVVTDAGDCALEVPVRAAEA